MGGCQSRCSNATVPVDVPAREVKVVVFGLDNSGKSTLLANLNGETTEDITPTIGFSSTKLNIDNTAVTFYDVGGGPRIRGIWKNYYSEAYGVIFVVDSSSPERFTEAKNVLNEVLQHEKIVGKPLLVFANKQDQDGASDDTEIGNQFNLDELLGDNRQYSTVVKCIASKSASGNKSDPSLKQGLSWLLRFILDRYSDISDRVKVDVTAQREREAQERRERMERVRKIREERERQRTLSGEGGGEDFIDGGEQPMVNPFRPISQVAEEAEKREQTAKAARKRKGLTKDESIGPASVAENTANDTTDLTDSRRDESAYASPGPSVPALKIMSQISQPSSGLSESDDEDTLTDVTPHSHGSSNSLRLSTSINSTTIAADIGSDNQWSSSSSLRKGGRLEPLQSQKSKKEKKKQRQLLLSRLKNRNKTAPAPSPGDGGGNHHPPVSRNTWTEAELEPVFSSITAAPSDSPVLGDPQQEEHEDPFHGLPQLPQGKRVLPPIKLSRQQAGMGKKTFHIAEDITVVPQQDIIQVSHPPPMMSVVEPLST